MTEEGKAAVDRRRVRRAEDDTERDCEQRQEGPRGKRSEPQRSERGERGREMGKAGENGLLWGRGGWM